MSNAIIIIKNTEGVETTIDASSEDLRDRLVAEASSIETVSDSMDYAQASDLAKTIKAFLGTIDESRKEAKRPVDDLAALIQKTAADFSAPLRDQHDRLGKLVLSFEDAERRRREEVERKARDEAYRIACEAQAKAEAAAREAAEKARANGADEREAAKAASDAANAVDDAAAKQAAEVKQQLANTVTAKAKGMRRTTTVKFEVTDEAAMHTARPDLFSPDETKIRAALKLTKEIPGLKVWEETKI